MRLVFFSAPGCGSRQRAIDAAGRVDGALSLRFEVGKPRPRRFVAIKVRVLVDDLLEFLSR